MTHEFVNGECRIRDDGEIAHRHVWPHFATFVPHREPMHPVVIELAGRVDRLDAIPNHARDRSRWDGGERRYAGTYEDRHMVTMTLATYRGDTIIVDIPRDKAAEICHGMIGRKPLKVRVLIEITE